MELNQVTEIPHYKWRHKGNPSRIYIVRVGEVIYYGSILTHICDYINTVTNLKLRLPGLYDSITLRVRKNPLYKGTVTTLIKNASTSDWIKIEKTPNSIHVK